MDLCRSGESTERDVLMAEGGNGKVRKTSEKTSVVGYGKNGNLTPGNPGNKGGGRRPHRVREVARASFSDRIHILEEIADDEEERSSDRIGALKLLADTGGVDKIALTLEEQPETEMTPERIAEVWERLQMIKTIKAFEKLLVGSVK